MAKHAQSDGGSQDTARISKSELDAVLKRTRSGVRPAVRPVAARTTPHEDPPPKSVHRLASNRFTADEQPTRPAGTRRAAIELVAHDESASDRLADEMYQAVVSARTSTTIAVAPARQTTDEEIAPMPAPKAAAFASRCAVDDELFHELEAIDELTRERTQALALLVNLTLLTAVAATLAWYASHAFGPLLH